VTILKLSDSVLLVVLNKEPDTRNDIAAINEMILKRCDADIIIDFSQVELLASAAVSNLLLLRQQVSMSGHKLILINVAFATKCILNTLGIQEAFYIAADKTDALDALLSTAN